MNYCAEEILANWDCDAEQQKVDLLEYLYEVYGVNTGLYTGLFERFAKDAALFVASQIGEKPDMQNELLKFIAGRRLSE
jgi:hypothetical protein